MIRISKTEVEPHYGTVGEVNCLKWKNVIFKWSCTVNNSDEYVANGRFVGLDPKNMYERLTIRADLSRGVFHLKTGRGKPITWINLLGV